MRSLSSQSEVKWHLEPGVAKQLPLHSCLPANIIIFILHGHVTIAFSRPKPEAYSGAEYELGDHTQSGSIARA